MGRRAENAAETRQRIIQATYELHKEKGIAATTVRDIAERADVSPGTVYHHFPEYGDVIVACGGYTFGIMRPPTREIFAGLETRAARLRLLVESTFEAYRRFPEYEKVRVERDAFPELEQAFAMDEEKRRYLIREALKPSRVARREVALAFALLDISVYHRLVSGGMSHTTAVAEVYELLAPRLLDEREAEPSERQHERRAP